MTSDRHGPVPLLHDHLLYAARHHGDRVALVCGGRRLTYAQCHAESDALARHFSAMGVAPGDRVLIVSDNGWEAVVAFWAVLKANAVACVVSGQTKGEKLAFLLADAEPTALVVEARNRATWSPTLMAAPALKTVVVTGGNGPSAAQGSAETPGRNTGDAASATLPEGLQVEWDQAQVSHPGTDAPPRQRIDHDLAALIYTSGSTGRPKGVMLTHRNMLAATESITSLLSLRTDDVVLSVLPLAFNYGLYQVILMCRAAGRLVLERSFAFPAHVLQRMREEGVTGFPGVPTQFALLAALPQGEVPPLPGVRFITNTAAALTPRHIAALGRWFPRGEVFSMYGLTECKRCTCLPPADLARKPGSVGVAIPNTEVWLVDEHGQRLPNGHTGELVVRGATVMRGYWKRPEDTAKALRPGPLPGEWVLHTGDVCRTDDEGHVYVVGRMDDLIKSRGEKVAPAEVERVLCSLPGVREAAVIGLPDEVLGQAVHAFVVADDGVALQVTDLLRACRQRLEPHLVPQALRVMDDLPRTETGKIHKAALATLTPMDAAGVRSTSSP